MSEKLVDLYFFIKVIQELDALLITQQNEKSKKEQNKAKGSTVRPPKLPTKRAR